MLYAGSVSWRTAWYTMTLAQKYTLTTELHNYEDHGDLITLHNGTIVLR